MKIDILILVESKERELESACLLQEELKKRGYKVLVQSVYPNKEILPFKYNPKLVITPWSYNNNDMKLFTCFYKNPNTKILNLHHEQYSGNNEQNACIPKDEAKTIFHISWGEEFTKELIYAGCNKEMICQSGNIRLDFFKSEFKQMSKSRKELADEFKLDENKKWVLFVANGYHLANEKGLDNMCSIDKNARKKAGISKKTRIEFLRYVDKYLSENDDAVFIYRPHPVYSFLDMKQPEIKKLCNKYKERFICNFSYSIRNWIVNVDSVMSFHSTSGVECMAAQKNYILFRPIEFNSNIDYEFYKNYPYIIKNYNDFIKYIEMNEYIMSKDVYKNYFDIKENEFSFVIICDFIDKIMNNFDAKNKINFKWYIQTFCKMIKKELLILFSKISLFRNILLSTGDTRIKHMIKNEEDFISEEEITAISEKIHNIIGEIK